MNGNTPDFLAALDFLHQRYEDKIPFCKFLGLKIKSLEPDDIRVFVPARNEFTGNYVKGLLHGGVISGILDTTGGLTASRAILEQMEHPTPETLDSRLYRMGTIDLRVDFLRPGKGNHFVATGSVMRLGNKVAVIRMHLYNDKEIHIAAGTGTYIVG